MSDIKYILAAADNGEHTRFPCLAVVRYAAATVVTVLALAVIALVIHAVLRSEDIRLSLNHGYIGADMLWNETLVGVDPTIICVNLQAQRTNKAHRSQATDQPYVSISGTDPTPAAPTLGMNKAGCPWQVTYRPAKMMNLRVTLIANNPGGRTKIDCNDTTVSLIDDHNFEIGNLKLDNFTVPPQTTITLQQRLKINDSDTLAHLWEYYGGNISFSVKVQVSANVTSYPLGKKTTKPRTYVCDHVTVGLTDLAAYLVADDAECRGDLLS